MILGCYPSSLQHHYYSPIHTQIHELPASYIVTMGSSSLSSSLKDSDKKKKKNTKLKTDTASENKSTLHEQDENCRRHVEEAVESSATEAIQEEDKLEMSGQKSKSVVKDEQEKSATDDDQEGDDDDQNEENDETNILTETPFASLGVCEPLVDACNHLGWSSATLIQEKVLPDALSGRDIIGTCII